MGLHVTYGAIGVLRVAAALTPGYILPGKSLPASLINSAIMEDVMEGKEGDDRDSSNRDIESSTAIGTVSVIDDLSAIARQHIHRNPDAIGISMILRHFIYLDCKYY